MSWFVLVTYMIPRTRRILSSKTIVMIRRDLWVVYFVWFRTKSISGQFPASQTEKTYANPIQLLHNILSWYR